LKEAAYQRRLRRESKPSLQSEGSIYSVLVDVQNKIQYQYYDHYKVNTVTTSALRNYESQSKLVPIIQHYYHSFSFNFTLY